MYNSTFGTCDYNRSEIDIRAAALLLIKFSMLVYMKGSERMVYNLGQLFL